MRWKVLGFVLALTTTAGFAGTSIEGPAPGAAQAAVVQQAVAPGPDQAWCPVAGDPGAGVHVMGIEHGGLLRSYEAHVPASYDGAIPAPLVVALHGFASGPAEMAALSGLDAVADLEGFITVYPEGFVGSWNSGECCGAASVASVDDVDFVVSVARDAAERFCVDTDRVYIAGLATGDMMAARIAGERPDVFVAAASLPGSDPLAQWTGTAFGPLAEDAAWQMWESFSGSW